MAKLLVTGGAGFIGANFVHHWLGRHPRDRVVVLDALTYAGNRAQPRCRCERCRACTSSAATSANRRWSQSCCASEQHRHARALRRRVPRRPLDRRPGRVHPDQRRRHARLLRRRAQSGRHDGRCAGSSLPPRLDRRGVRLARRRRSGVHRRPRRTRRTRPYSASKAASDHLVRAYHHTYGLPVTTSNCSNNYGPYQFPEKLIPLMLVNALRRPDRCRSTATARTCATGCTSRIIAAPSNWCSSAAASARPTTSAAAANAATSISCRTLCAMLDAPFAATPRSARRVSRSAPRQRAGRESLIRSSPIGPATTGAMPSMRRAPRASSASSRRDARHGPAENRALVSRQ